MSQIYFELASIWKNRSSNFWGFTIHKICTCNKHQTLRRSWRKVFSTALSSTHFAKIEYKNVIAKEWQLDFFLYCIITYFQDWEVEIYCRGRVLDSRPSVRGFKPHRRYSVVPWARHINPSLAMGLPSKTRPYIIERLLMCIMANKILLLSLLNSVHQKCSFCVNA